ncbi:MAG: hypothetical protein MJE77_16155 [Proteobacteria bacterium]|nr:hypothetical protein [Pseudomonadota bacterium]
MLALVWPALAHADGTDREREARFVAESQLDERSVAARLSAGGVWLGDDSIDGTSAIAPFLAVAAQLDFWVQPRYSLHVMGTFGQLVGPARYFDVPCPRSGTPPDCMADAQRAAIWSSLAVGSTWVHDSSKWVVNARTNLGILFRRHSHGRMIDRSISTEPMNLHPTAVGEFGRNSWHISPVASFAAGFGHRLHPMWVGGLEVEIQVSAPIGTPLYVATAVNLVLHRHWDP